MKTALNVFHEALDHVRETDARVVFLKGRGFLFDGANQVISWRRKQAPDDEENAVMVDLFLHHGYGGFSLTS